MAENVSCTPSKEVFKLPAMSKEETDALLKSQRICRMALNDSPHPYIIPLDYVYMDGKLYFHFANYGRKVELYRRDPHVSVEIDKYNDDITDYRSVTLMGRLADVKDKNEKEKAAQALLNSIMARGGAGRVAARHGFDCMDHDVLMSSGSLLLRLDVDDTVALKSPDK